ncbi:probable choline kinase 2 [Impatiens glandulifera]|uniref:probable choline kinase 2 n=1 Tax=Impatiens glandulifera TaxID=253017 RepID=UPI001FB199D4|nr:probable choline kinase 2 [Impatiens glandulifera]
MRILARVDFSRALILQAIGRCPPSRIHKTLSLPTSDFSLIPPLLYPTRRETNSPNFALSEMVTPKIGKERLPTDAKKILESIASSWGVIIEDVNLFQVIPLKGAMTNEVYQIKWPKRDSESESRKVLVRIYGEGVDVFFNRDDEIRTFECMSHHGQGPRLLGRFSNGRVEEFIHARTLSAFDLCNPSISALIAAKMKEFHDLPISGPQKVLLWERLRNWLETAKTMASTEQIKEFRLDTMGGEAGEISFLEKTLSHENQCIGFCHNDLQYGNIMIDEETNSITLIDYEYASYNPIAYDIANHFCEMAADYHTEMPHILDYTKYPNADERQQFLRAYLNCADKQLKNLELDMLIKDVEMYTLASHLLWGLWGIISEHVNDIDFDYIEYARQRFREYWQRKGMLLGSSG